ncbi:mitochondrial carrier domain-containing protein [Dipodascopsis uninucleata]
MSNVRTSPLRPYYHPPELIFQDGLPGYAINDTGANISRSDALFSDLDYVDYFDLQNISDGLKSLTNAILMKYSSTLLAQPLEMAKMVLQCEKLPRRSVIVDYINRNPSDSHKRSRSSTGMSKKKNRKSRLDDIDTFEVDLSDESDKDEELNYFTTLSEPSSLESRQHSSGSDTSQSSQGDQSKRPRRQKGKLVHRRSPSTYLPHEIGPHNPYIRDVIGALWKQDGPWGILKGTNVSFIQSLLFNTFESWLFAFLSAVFGLSDISLLDVADSYHPILSLFTSIGASTVAALILSPLDIVRTRLMLTPSGDKPRSIMGSLKLLPSILCPSHLIIPTALFVAFPRTISRGTPHILRSKWGIEQYQSPVLYNLFFIGSAVAELFFRLPLETVLRRGQLAYFNASVSRDKQPEGSEIRTVVPVGEYNGMLGTMWNIISTEDNGSTGLEGLWRGWRVGLFGIIGARGFRELRSRTSIYNGQEERF